MPSHRKRRQTTSQGLENAALRVGQTGAIAASRRLADAHGIACSSAPNTRACLADAVHDQYSDRLLAPAVNPLTGVAAGACSRT